MPGAPGAFRLPGRPVTICVLNISERICGETVEEPQRFFGAVDDTVPCVSGNKECVTGANPSDFAINNYLADSREEVVHLSAPMTVPRELSARLHVAHANAQLRSRRAVGAYERVPRHSGRSSIFPRLA
jgi:hypothetical protein